MLNHHPDSPFIIKQSKLNQTLDMFEKNIRIYQGYAYTDSNICVLWNKIFVTDPSNVNRVITENAYMPPKEKFNGVSIDFAVFNSMIHCQNFIKDNDEESIKYILFIREGRPKIYKKEEIINHIPR
jgi:hypothetical protein